MSHEFESRDNFQARLYFLSYSALAVVTLQLPVCFTHVALWRLASRETPFECTQLEFLHTFSHITLTFHGTKGIYSRVCEECEKLVFIQTGHSGDLASRLK